MGDTAPLISREPDAHLACLFQENTSFVSAQLFLTQVKTLAALLPEGQHGINLCDSRYLFLVSLCALVLREQTNLFPSNKNIATQARISERYDDAYIIHDGAIDLAQGIKQVDVSNIEWSEISESYDVPDIKLEHVAAISFTSGSTGDAKPNIKTWCTLVQSTAINSLYMLPNNKETFYHLATVPGQHMWGLETSVLMSLFSNVCLVDSRPLFPHDVIQSLNKLPNPKTLISTPLHLRALNALDEELPKLANVLSATAPLNKELAADIENKCSVEVREVYGCSEVGSMAIRRPSQTDVWERFSDLIFSIKNDQVLVSTEYLPAEVKLEDKIQMLDENRFLLQGRSADQVNIAGKRGSLDEVNKVLLSFPEIIDGVVFFPEQSQTVPRLVALVVLPEKIKKELLAKHLRKYLDAVFVPRPIIKVDALPREENGKLVKAKLHEFYQAIRQE